MVAVADPEAQYGTFVPESRPSAHAKPASRPLRAMVTALAVCAATLALVLVVSSPDSLVLDESSAQLAREAKRLEHAADTHKSRAQHLQAEFARLEAQIGSQGNKALLAAAAAPAAGKAAAAPAAGKAAAAPAAGKAAAPAAKAAGKAAAPAAKAAGKAAAAGKAGASGSAGSSAEFPKHSDDHVVPARPQDAPVPKEVHASSAVVGLFSDKHDDDVDTAGDEFLTVKALLKKVQDRQKDNNEALADAKTKFADDTFIPAADSSLAQPLAGFLGPTDIDNDGLGPNPEGPVQAAGPGPSFKFRDTFDDVVNTATGNGAAAGSAAAGKPAAAAAPAAGGKAAAGKAAAPAAPAAPAAGKPAAK